MKTIIQLLCLTLIALAALGQTTTTQSPASPPQEQSAADLATTSSNYTSAKGFVLEDGTPVKMRINRTISSADAHTGDTVDFEVLEDISVNGTPVIAKGGLAFATVTEAQSKRRMARGGKLDINVDYVKLLSSEKAALRAVKDMKGGGHTGAMVGGMVATSIVFFPAAPFFLFMHGKDISIPKGTEITAYVNGDMKLDIAMFQQNSASQPSASETSNSAANTTTGKLRVESDPSGADIEIDGSFVGNTPSDVQVAEGDHAVTVKKAGFQNWERKTKISGGSSVHINAGLEKEPAHEGSSTADASTRACVPPVISALAFLLKARIMACFLPPGRFHAASNARPALCRTGVSGRRSCPSHFTGGADYRPSSVRAKCDPRAAELVSGVPSSPQLGLERRRRHRQQSRTEARCRHVSFAFRRRLLCHARGKQSHWRRVYRRWKFHSRSSGIRTKHAETSDQGRRVQ